MTNLSTNMIIWCHEHCQGFQRRRKDDRGIPVVYRKIQTRFSELNSEFIRPKGGESSCVVLQVQSVRECAAVRFRRWKKDRETHLLLDDMYNSGIEGSTDRND